VSDCDPETRPPLTTFAIRTTEAIVGLVGGVFPLVSNGSLLRWRIVVQGRFAVGCAWMGGVVELAGRQLDLFGAVVAVASVVP
jgi:hypothetical protein